MQCYAAVANDNDNLILPLLCSRCNCQIVVYTFRTKLLGNYIFFNES